MFNYQLLPTSHQLKSDFVDTVMPDMNRSECNGEFDTDSDDNSFDEPLNLTLDDNNSQSNNLQANHSIEDLHDPLFDDIPQPLPREPFAIQPPCSVDQCFDNEAEHDSDETVGGEDEEDGFDIDNVVNENADMSVSSMESINQTLEEVHLDSDR